MCHLVEQSDLVVPYRTCIHRTVHLSYGLGFGQAHDEIAPQNQTVISDTRRKTEEFESGRVEQDWILMNRLETHRPEAQGRIRGMKQRLVPGFPWKIGQSELDIVFLLEDRRPEPSHPSRDLSFVPRG